MIRPNSRPRKNKGPETPIAQKTDSEIGNDKRHACAALSTDDIDPMVFVSRASVRVDELDPEILFENADQGEDVPTRLNSAPEHTPTEPQTTSDIPIASEMCVARRLSRQWKTPTKSAGRLFERRPIALLKASGAERECATMIKRLASIAKGAQRVRKP